LSYGVNWYSLCLPLLADAGMVAGVVATVVAVIIVVSID
jgi:hypothetical protein